MTKEKIITIDGGQRLTGGRISISGSSNQVTKCIVAGLLTDSDIIINRVPCVDERRAVEELFQFLGGKVEECGHDSIRINAKTVDSYTISKEHCQKNRISILAVGPLLHRFKKAAVYKTLGGDRIGARPVDFHIDGLRKMGALVEMDQDIYHLKAPPEGLRGAHIVLPFPSVMTTENLLITATMAKGTTIIENAAIEPEVIELCKMLQKMGADITLNANRTFIVEGVKRLEGCETTLMLDRNQAVSFAIAALATGGDVLLEGITHDSVYTFLNFIQRMGAEFKINSNSLYVQSPKNRKLNSTHIEVDVHPGFMTDWQQPFMVLFTQAQGVSILHETVFDNRLGYIEYLNSMGALITVSTKCLGEVPCRFRSSNHVHSAIIQGPTPLSQGSFSLPTDIRAGMCLVIAGLVASGRTKLSNIHELERKYDNLVPKLRMMGANMEIAPSPGNGIRN